MRIGNIEINNKVILAPMAGVTSQAFRKIAREFGVELTYTEMISDKGLLHNNKKTLGMVNISKDEYPIAIQLFGDEIDAIIKAAKYIDQHTNADIIDFNMGCPVNKVVTAGAGSALLKDPDKVYEIVKGIVDNVNKPVSVKIRSGWTNKEINILEVAKKIEEAGASLIAVHPRTRSDMYSGKSNWDLIRQVKEIVKIPVIGNGDILSPEDALKMIEETKCDAVMVGRGALGNPWLLKNINDFFITKTYNQEVSVDEKISVLLRHMDYLITEKGEKLALLEMRSHAAWYVKGLKNATEFKKRLSSVTKKEELMNLVEEFRKAFS